MLSSTDPVRSPEASDDKPTAIRLPERFKFRRAGSSGGARPTYVPYTGIGRIDSALAMARDKWHGAIAGAVTALLFMAVTWGIAGIGAFLHGRRPPLVYYIVPVAFAAATLGRKVGLAVTLLASILSAIFLTLDANTSGYKLGSVDILAILGTLIATVMVVTLIGRLRESLDELSAAHARELQVDAKLMESEERRIQFSREVLLAVTGGRLLLCDDSDIARSIHGSRLLHHPLREPKDVTLMRKAARKIIEDRALLTARLYDFEATSTEAATNAIKHGNGGYYELWNDGDNTIALVVDTGGGIEPKDLARATLERGFSTHVSLGLGFKMMWELADQIAVSTSDAGTTILIRVADKPRVEVETSILDRYPTLED